jgi:hypothetical protein
MVPLLSGPARVKCAFTTREIVHVLFLPFSRREVKENRTKKKEKGAAGKGAGKDALRIISGSSLSPVLSALFPAAAARRRPSASLPAPLPAAR